MPLDCAMPHVHFIPLAGKKGFVFLRNFPARKEHEIPWFPFMKRGSFHWVDGRKKKIKGSCVRASHECKEYGQRTTITNEPKLRKSEPTFWDHLQNDFSVTTQACSSLFNLGIIHAIVGGLIQSHPIWGTFNQRYRIHSFMMVWLGFI